MSSCLILQAKDKLYIGADTSSSVFIDDKLYRLNNNTKKLFLLNDNTVLYCAGNNSIAEKVVQHISSIYCRNDFSLISLKNWLIEMYPYKNKDKTVYDVEILIATFKNNRTIVYQMSQYKNYDIVSFEVSDTGVQILSAGIKNAECMSFAENELLNKSGVKSIFRTTFNNLSCNYIGGCLDLYEITKNGAVKIFDNEKINEHGIQYVYDVFNGISVSLNAEVLVSKLVMSENLWIENSSGNYKFNDSGFIATNGNNTIKIQPNNSGELFSIYKGSSKQVYINSDGDVEFAGSLKSASGQFAGLVSGGSIDIGNGVFTVDKNGNLYASSGQFAGLVSGGSINIKDKFIVDKDGNVTAKSGSFSCDITGSSGTFGDVTLNNEGISSTYFKVNYSGAYIDGIINAGAGSQIGGWTITNGKIYGGDSYTGVAVMQKPSSNTTYVFAAGGKSHSSYADCPFKVTKDGKMYASSGKISEFDITENGLEWGNYGTKIWANTIKTDYIESSSSSPELKIGETNKKTLIYGKGGLYVNDTLVSLSGHTHSNYVSSCSYNTYSGKPSTVIARMSKSGNSLTFAQYSSWSSDKRLKTNITDLPDLTSIYMKIPLKKFKFNSKLEGYDKDWHYGFLAQDIESLLSEEGIGLNDTSLVYKVECEENFHEKEVVNDNYIYKVDKNELHAMHIQMIQKQQHQIEELKKDIKELKEYINELKVRVS